MNETMIFPTLEAVKEARKSIENVVNYTPLQYNTRLSEKFGANIFLKREDLQPVRSYKLRGAYNKIKTLFNEGRVSKGIVCASAGNHAQGVAFSCKQLQIKGTIFMPVTTPKQKDCIPVDEGKVCDTILQLYNKDAIVLEPAGALSISALEQYRNQIKGKNVVCIVSGSNNDITRMEEIKERALLYNGLKHYFMVKFPQRPGSLKDFVLNVLGENDDITHFEYTKKNSRETALAIVGIELSNISDFNGLKQRMQDLGYFESYLNDIPDMLNMMV